MTRQQKNQQVMGNSVAQTNTNYKPTWEGSELFNESDATHSENLINIQNWEIKQAEAAELKGLVRDKNILRSIIAGNASRIVSGIKAYAMSVNDQQLFTSVAPYTLSKLSYNFSDTKFATAIGSIKTIADANAASILPFGITAAMLTSFAADVTSFQAIAPKPKALRGQLKAYTANLKKAVKDMLEYLKANMDNQVRSLFPATDFEAAYFNSRKIYNYNESVTGIKGTITNIENGKAIRNAIVEMIDYPLVGENSIRSTNEAGNYHFKKVSLTKATIRVRANDFTTAEFEVNVTKNRITDFDIQLTPALELVPVTA